MSDFALTFLYVVPSTNSVPTTGSTQDLTAGQTGVFLPDYTAGDSSSVVDEPYIYIDQGRTDKSLPTFRSDKIAASKVVHWTKTVGSASAVNEIWEVGAFEVPAGQQVTLTINAHSFYLDTAFYNGYTRSITVTPDCLDCGDDPCAIVPNETVIDKILAAINADFNGLNRTSGSLTQFFDFEKIGTGDDAIIRITAKALTVYGQECDLAAFPHMFDRLWFRPFVYLGPDTSADFITSDACIQAATTTLTQRSQFAKLTSDEVAQLEKDYYSYKVDRFKQLYRRPGWNGLFESFVEDGKVYTQYLIDFIDYDGRINGWNPVSEKQIYRVLIFVPDEDEDIEDILVAYLGEPVDESGTSPTTTTTTSTSSTTTSTTTTLIP